MNKPNTANLFVLNAQVTGVLVGSNVHDGRAFISLAFEFDGGGQSVLLPKTTDTDAIDRIISVCGARES